MQAHQERVVDEARELRTRLDKLTEFLIGSPVYRGLPEDEKIRLHLQQRAMRTYWEILTDRIAAFKD
jgi:hypothetical protein